MPDPRRQKGDKKYKLKKEKIISIPKDKNFFNPSLEKCFRFWDKFLESWFCKKIFEDKNIQCSIDLSQENYMPEPYWGWNGKGDLYSVVINYHPGKGGAPQNRNNILKIFDDSLTYKESMVKDLKKELSILQKELKFKTTEEWHLNERAKPLGKLIKINPKDTSHHLSLEFSPFHSENITDVVSFIKAYPEIVIAYILGFAAQASRQITGSLKNKVFVRVSDDNFHRYLKILGFQKISERDSFSGNKMPIYKESPQSSFICEGYGNLNSYNLSPWPNIEFIRVTGSHNHFPTEIKPIN